MKKPYLRRYGTISKFTIYIVDGMYIRDHIDEEFTNFGQHYRFRFIPPREFWIDREHGGGKEIHFYIDHMLTEHRLMSKGKSYGYALSRADAREHSERNKSKLMARFNNNHANNKPVDNKIIRQIHQRLLKTYSGKVKIWIVNGELVRDMFFIDFTEGGHDLVYHFVPRNEIWIDDDVSLLERKYVLLHELHERNLMAENLLIQQQKSDKKSRCQLYLSAHRQSSEIEFFCRHHPARIDKQIREELRKSTLWG